jgi:hypothetical protein
VREKKRETCSKGDKGNNGISQPYQKAEEPVFEQGSPIIPFTQFLSGPLKDLAPHQQKGVAGRDKIDNGNEV